MSKPKKSKKAKYSAIIIGAGRIASGFDEPESPNILTHAHAYQDNGNTELLGFFDTDQRAAARAARKWNCRSFASMGEVEQAKPDIVSICTPNDTHADYLRLVAGLKPKMVICEKPATASLKETEEIARLYEKSAIPVLVNYTRRFNEVFGKLKKEIAQGKYGKVMSGSGVYVKGVLHNGSHLIDFCRYLLGDVVEARPMQKFSNYDNQNDANVSGLLRFSKCDQFYLIANDNREYFILEIDLLFEKGRLRFLDEGYRLSVSRVINDPVFKGYRCLSEPKIIETGLNRAFKILMENAVDHLNRKTALRCSLDDALKVQKICSDLSNFKI